MRRRQAGICDMAEEILRITGGQRLEGTVTVNGGKNAALAIIPAVLLCNEPCTIENLPFVRDTEALADILLALGAKVTLAGSTMTIDPRGVKSAVVPEEYARRLRASYYFVGAMLGCFGQADVSYPGGCAIGNRPIDQHIKGFEALGATVTTDYGFINATSEEMFGSHIYLDVVSVGATVNIMLAAVRAKGLTILENAAKEPHIVDLANFLNSMGADIRGAGTDVIKIHGVDLMHGTTYPIIPDQIEAGTYMTMTAAAGGEVLIKNVIPKHLEAITDKLIQAGCEIEEYDDSILVRRTGKLVKTNVKTLPHPGFPTDMQPQMTTLLAIAQGTSIVTEGVWDNRFKYVDELHRMGAKIQVDGKVAVVEGVEQLSGAHVKALDLRAGVALVQAALSAKGTSEIEDIHWVERGYEDLVGKLQGLGADIRKVTIPDAAFAKNA